MFGSTVIDVAIGLVFVYLLLSFIVTAIQEVIETAVKLRAAHLAKGVHKLLGSDKAKEFFDHPLIEEISPDKWFGKGTRKPSYIASHTFATALLDIILKADIANPRTTAEVQAGINTIPDPKVRRSLTVLLQDCQRDLVKFKEGLENWFNDQMDRVSGWYKRKVQVITITIGLLIAVGINADTLSIIKRLSNDSTLRSSLVAQSQEIAKQPISRSGEENIAAIETRINKVEALGLPFTIGWWKGRDKFPWESVPGWLLTGFAVSLGAPFWFDILNKVISIRSSGKSPAEAEKK